MVTGLESVLKMRWFGLRTFIRYPRSMVKCVTLVVMLVEAIVILRGQMTYFRVTRVLRPIFLYDSYYCSGLRRYLRQVSDQHAHCIERSIHIYVVPYRQILKSVIPALEILLLLLFVMLFFSVLGFFLFDSVPNDTNFTTLRQSFISLFVLLTTSK